MHLFELKSFVICFSKSSNDVRSLSKRSTWFFIFLKRKRSSANSSDDVDILACHLCRSEAKEVQELCLDERQIAPELERRRFHQILRSASRIPL